MSATAPVAADPGVREGESSQVTTASLPLPVPTFASPVPPLDDVRVTPLDADGWRVTVVKQVRVGDPYLAGHFPGNTMLPAVFLLEAVRRAVAEHVAGTLLDVSAVRSARLLAPMVGGATLTATLEVRRLAGGTWRAAGDVVADGADGVLTDGLLPVARLSLDLATAQVPAPATEGEEPASTGAARTDVLTHAQLAGILPLGHPMLLVDAVTDVVPGARLRSRKAVSASEPCYAAVADGSPPQAYRYPRSLALESFGQSAALVWLSGQDWRLDGGVLMLAAMRDVVFTGEVLPGEVLRHDVVCERVVADNAILSGEIFAGNRRVATVGSLLAVIRRG